MEALADALRHDPARPDQVTQTAILVASPDEAASASGLDLLIQLESGGDVGAGEAKDLRLAKSWANSGVPVIVVLPRPTDGERAPLPQNISQPYLVAGPIEDLTFLAGPFAEAVLRLLPTDHIALARQFPVFRSAVAKSLIADTSYSNAAYALSTGLAEIVPVFNIPLNIADMVVLSKAQAFLVYRLGLALGLSSHWQDYVAEFGGVLGSGFLWRQIARSLVGLIPAWGILPKVAVSYAGTYVVGNVVHQWYLTGRHLSGRQMRQLYTQAFARGKNLAQSMGSKLPKLKRKPKELDAGKEGAQAPTGIERPPRRPLLSRGAKGKNCSNCGKKSTKDAQFCQYCGREF